MMSEQQGHKMYDYAVAPPPAAWESIAARLDDDIKYTAVSSKMNGFETPPPSFIWADISLALDEKKENKTNVISARKIFLRSTAAAVSIAVFIGGWLALNKTSSKPGLVKQTVIAPVQPVIIKNTPASGNNRAKKELVFKQPKLPVQPGEKNNRNHPADADKENRRLYATVTNQAIYQNAPVAAITAPPVLDNNGEPIMDIDVLTVNSNYLLVTGPNGQLTRISSKFASVIRYLDAGSTGTEEYLDKVIKESGIWKKRFEEWRNKISQSAYIPSSVNFLDIAELKELVQEK